ncbi:MAG: SdiA-regulated domain-containing protein [bacterium]
MAILLFILVRLLPGANDLPEIKGYDFSSKKNVQHKLARELSEASGLSFTRDGRLLCHNDEQGAVYEVDYRTGKILSRFYLGKFLVYRDDLEGIATKGDTIFMVNSSGAILRFLPGKDGEKVAFQTFKTPLSVRNDVEGLAYDPVTDCLLLACKGEASVDYRNPLPADQKAVYAFSLKTYKLLLKPRFLIPVLKITATTGGKEFNPSSIERHPITGHFFVLAANGNALVEMDANGNLIGASSLPKAANPQPEGLAIAPDGTIIICNEGSGKTKVGKLCVYPPI